MENKNETEAKESRDSEYRRRILDAARKLLEQNGPDNVNMYQIAQEAGIGQGTLYRRYNHPGEIYGDLMRTSLQRFLDELEAFRDRMVSAGSASALEGLYELIVRSLQYIDDNAELLALIRCMYAGKKSLILSKTPMMQRLHDLLKSQLELAERNGETPPIDPAGTAGFLLAVLTPEQYLYYRDTAALGKDRYLAGIRRLFIDGLRIRGEKPQ
ncbi:TetR/AcrR family transcriptional regulator [Cohnella caldifontis]|uniref:TetR/AcrR family transcriptional regulator n=1 Tax=Cohnella caldifontis TaxID=3027471 RepID=UPI0023EC09E6|nr:TetR/AcrR family transcriptional regulator [Cohnella sp. YIM B05605]